MTDQEITRLCAEAMGWRAYAETRGEYTLCVTVAPEEDEPWERSRNSKQEKKRYKQVSLDVAITVGFFGRGLPDPLHDDAQVMAMVKQFWMIIRGETTPLKPSPFWRAMMPEVPMYSVTDPNLNRAVSTCVAEWWAAKKGK